MAQTFWGGFAEGLGGGINYGLQIQEAKQRKKELEETKQLQLKILDDSKRVAQAIDTFLSDGYLSDDDYYAYVGIVSSAAKEIQERYDSIVKDIRSGQFDKAKQEREALSSMASYYFNDIDYSKLSSEDIDGLIDELDKQFVSPEAKKYLQVLKETMYTRKKGTQLSPEELAAKEMAGWKGAGVPPEQHIPYTAEKYGLPFTAPSPELTALEKNIQAIQELPIPEEAKEKAILNQIGASPSTIEEKMALAGKYGFSLEDAARHIIFGAEKKTTAGEVVPEEVEKFDINQMRAWDAAGEAFDMIISTYPGDPNTFPEETKQQILNSASSFKNSLPADSYNKLMSMLEATNYLPSGTPPVQPQTPEESDWLSNVKSWAIGRVQSLRERLGGAPPSEAVAQPPQPQSPSIPTSQPTPAKNYQNMTDDELADLVLENNDMEAYQELKRRGLLE